MSLENKFEFYREETLSGLWIHYEHIKPLIEKLPKTIFSTKIVGHSEKHTPIHTIEVGKGPINILLWSQMHGDESTATKVLFDIFNFITNEYLTNKAIGNLLQQCTLTFVPIVNPDGALLYTRENANGLDLNRDAQEFNTKEATVLNSLVTSIKPDFAFNLHDQTSWYNVAGTEKVATLSFLSPAADQSKKLTKSRTAAMRVIASMFASLQEMLPNQMGRYNDAYCANCFGDSVQSMGIPTILIESGYFPGDETRKKTRKFHFIALLSAIFDIATDNLPKYDAYLDIPLNEKLFYDKRIDNVLYKNKLTSVAIRYIYKIEHMKLVKVIDPEETIIGKALANKFFHKTVDGKGLHFDKIS